MVLDGSGFRTDGFGVRLETFRLAGADAGTREALLGRIRVTSAEYSAHTDPGLPLVSLVEQLRTERDGLRRAMRTRALIEQAKGILMAADGITADEAFLRLRARSQHSNVRLVDVAAALIADSTPPPVADARADLPARRSWPVTRLPAGTREPDPQAAPPTGGPPPPAESALHAQHLLLASHLSEATGYDDVIAALDSTTAGWPAPASVVLALPEPDGALRVVASHGLSPAVASQWSRVPPQVDVPLTATARTGAPTWLANAGELRRAYPIMLEMNPALLGSATLPLTVDDRLLGVLGLTWADPVDLDDLRRCYLRAAAGVVAEAVDRLSSPDGADRTRQAGQLWVRVVLDAALTPAALLTTVRAGVDVVDFRFAHLNTPAERAATAAGIGLAGSTLLTAMPGPAARTLVPLCRAVLADGVTRQLDDVAGPGTLGRYAVRVARLGDGVVATWRRHLPAEMLYDDLVAAERAVRVAPFRWQLTTDVLATTPVLGELLDWPAGRTASVRAVLDAVDRSDRARVRAAVFAALRTGSPVDLTVPVSRGRRWLRLVAEPLDTGGRVTGLRGWLQDVSDLRAMRSREHRLAEARGAHLSRRVRSEAER